MWIELALAAPGAVGALYARKHVVKGLRHVPLIKCALPALPAPAPSPTTVLAEMVALKLIQSLPEVRRSGTVLFNLGTAQLDWYVEHTAEFDSSTWYAPDRQFQMADKMWVRIKHVRLRTSKQEIALSDDEKKILCAAIEKVYHLQAQREIVKAEEDRQNSALEAISEIMGIDPKPCECTAARVLPSCKVHNP